MKMSNEGGFIFSVAVIVAVCVFVMALLLVLIIGGYDRSSSTLDEVNQASIVAGAAAILIVMFWFLIKAVAGHLVAHYLFKKASGWKRKKQESDEDKNNG